MAYLNELTIVQFLLKREKKRKKLAAKLPPILHFFTTLFVHHFLYSLVLKMEILRYSRPNVFDFKNKYEQ